MKFKSRDQQRRESAASMMASLGLEAHLRNLSREIIAGDLTKLSEFQQMIQYAPVEMKARIADPIAAR